MAPKVDGSTWSAQHTEQTSNGCRSAVLILASEYPNNMQSDLPTVTLRALGTWSMQALYSSQCCVANVSTLQALHHLAEVSLVVQSVDAALSLQPSQITVTAAAQHIEAIEQVLCLTLAWSDVAWIA